MNVRCPNCGAVFPGPSGGGEAECPLCLHSFAPDGNATVSHGGGPPLVNKGAAPGSDDEFESFGVPLSGSTVTLGSSSSPARGGLGAQSASGTDFGADFGAASTAAASPRGNSRLSDGLGLGGHDDFDDFGSASARAGGGDDPFAMPAGSGAEDVDFGALLGSVGEPSVAEEDPFGFSTSGDSLFGADGEGESFARRDSMEDDALFREDDEDSLFLATANTSGAIFDEDDDANDHHSPATPGRDEERAAPAKESSTSEDDERPKADLGALLDKAVIVGLVVLTAGVVLDYQGIPAFGLGDFLPSLSGSKQGDDAAKKAKARLRPIPQNLADPTDIKDTANTYQLEVERLKKVREVRPTDTEVTAKLHAAYLDLLERAPTVFLADPAYGREVAALEKAMKRPSPRFTVLNALGQGELGELEAQISALVKQTEPVADDLGTAAWALFRLEQAEVRQDALDHPGRINDPAVDPLLRARPKSTRLARASTFANRALEMAKQANNRLKFVMIKAQIDDSLGRHAENLPALTRFVPTAKDAVDARLLLISGLIRSNQLGKASANLTALKTWAMDEQDDDALRRSYLLEAWLAHTRGRVGEQISALEAAQKLDPDDELLTVRLGRLMLREHRAQECYKLLNAAKKRGLKSIAFEVALVEYWLWAHRNDDALEEIKFATKNYPESVDLLFLRGQVEEQEHHTATARDFYGKVIAREPTHLRAALRLATLQSNAGRHDDALSTLSQARKRLGPLESILELMAKELLVLRRPAEARKIYGDLLKRHPSNKIYLLNAARMDVKAGKIDEALKFLIALRKQGALDREGAQQLAMALASKGKPAEAAQTLVTFADREPNDIRLNALSGEYMLDSGNIERAETLLKRAFRVAHRQGGDAETLFQYGRLAFRKGEISNGISRMRQAIKAAPKTHHYRYVFAKALLEPANLQWPSAGKMAVEQLKWLIAYADRFEAAGNRIEYLADVYRTLAQYYFDTKRFAKAIPLLRKSLDIESNHLPTRVRLGNALFRVSDPRAEQVLRDVLRRQPNNYLGALYLGLTLQNKGRISEAITWLTRATRGKGPQLAEAWYQLAMIYRDRGQNRKVVEHLRVFLKRAPPNDPFRPDAVSLLNKLSN